MKTFANSLDPDQDQQNIGPDLSDSFTNLSLWVLGLAVSHIIESNCKLRCPEHYFSWQVCNTIASWDSMK